MRTFQKLCIAAFILLAGCTSGPQLPSATSAAPANAAPETSYVIGPGDLLDVFVWHNTDLSRQIPVRPDGRISMPLLGDIVAVGKTPDGLAQELQNGLKPFIKDPLVTVIPTSFVGVFTRQIRVVGEAVQPKAIQYAASMTVLDVMIQVGGLTKYADGDRAVLVRQVGATQKSYNVRLDSLVRDGDISKNVAMQPGDILIIPQRYF